MNSQSLEYVEGLLEEYLRDPASVPKRWHDRLRAIAEQNGFAGRATVGPSFEPASIFRPAPVFAGDGADGRRALDVAQLQERVDQLVQAYRIRGHRIAQLDPLGGAVPHYPELDPRYYGLSEEHLDRPLSTRSIQGPDVRTLGDLLAALRDTYCRSIGAQFMHISDIAIREWLQERMEGTRNRLRISRDTQLRILTRLTDAVIFEEFVRKKYIGAKTYSLEGGESLIPLLELAIEKAAQQGVVEIVLGMAHRGRLNVLANIIGKRPKEIFWEFEDLNPEHHRGQGDVKYHLGYSGDWESRAGQKVHLSLCFNPSHLEFVNPVAIGRTRAKQDRSGDTRRQRGMTLLIHGDASFAGEGVVQETLNLCQLPNYATGGTLHVLVNNQIGFTTRPDEGRSSAYATDVARMLEIPIFHVNGENPEAVAQAVNLAMDFRREFGRDAVIDMYCYRRWGHNEGDDPSYTQPLLYDKVERQPTVRDGYLDHLLTLDGVTREEADEIAEQRSEELEREFEAAQEHDWVPRNGEPGGIWKGCLGGEEPDDDTPETGVPADRLSGLLEQLTELPDDFHLHNKLERGWERRREMAQGERPLDWSAGEALAFATLALDGYRVRLAGQDSARGAFSQRHAVLHDEQDGHTYMPLAHLAEDQAPVEVLNSPLSELAALGFEYGYSLDYPDALVLWEAQFGDFVNAAQVIVDQFICSAEDKWDRLSGLVLLLPHGYEGQGPEHSSARLERFLSLAVEQNIQVAVPSTPGQYFHVLRRQMLRRWRKPLVLLTPKSLLRHPRAVSSLDDLAQGTFRRVLPEQELETDQPARVLLCAGKVYYDLVKAREKAERDDVALLRVEQLYPFPSDELESALERYPDETPVLWVQEEPENMGAWPSLQLRLGDRLLGRFPLAGVTRPESASPATGSKAAHKLGQQELVARALGEE